MLKINELSRLYLGIQGENEVRSITVDVAPWIEMIPNGSVTVWHKRNGDAAPSATGAVYDSETKTVTWTPTSVDTFVAGIGEAEFRLVEDDIIKKTRKIETGVGPSVTLAGTALGSDWQSYINAVDGIRALAVAAKNAAEEAAEEAAALISVEDLAGAEATTLEPDEDATAEIVTTEDGKKILIGVPQGKTGAKGDPGNADMLAPAFNAATANDAGSYVIYDGGLYYLPSGHNANTSWANTTKTLVKFSGEMSAVKNAVSSKINEPGTDGTRGQVLTTDGEGGRTWETVEGGASDYSEITNKPKINGVTLSGNNSLSDLGIASASEASAKYTKPSGGIPKTDLDTTVQASLGKADTALQGNDVATAVDDWLEDNFSNPTDPPLDRSLESALSAAPADLVGEARDELKYLQSIFACGKKVITNASINSSGVIVSETGRNLTCFRVTPGVYISASGTFELYGLFASEPALASVTYNNSRNVTSVLTGLKVPSGCYWIALRSYPSDTDQAITPDNNIGPSIQLMDATVAFDRYSDFKRTYIPVNGFLASSITRTSGKLISKDGREVTNAEYSLAEFTASADKIYYIRWRGGDGYTVCRGVELIQNSTVIGYCLPTTNGTGNEVVIKDFAGTVRGTYRATSDSDFLVTYCENPQNAVVAAFSTGLILGDFTKFYGIDFFPYSNNVWEQGGRSIVIELNDAITSITLDKDPDNLGMVLTYCNTITGIKHGGDVDYVSPGRVVTTDAQYSVRMDTGAKYVVIALVDKVNTNFTPIKISVNGHDVSEPLLTPQGQVIDGIVFDDLAHGYSAYIGKGGTAASLVGVTGSKKNTIVAPQSCTLVTDPSTFHDNSAFGYHAMYGIRQGYHNTAIGSEALDRPTGNGNTAVGFYACAGRNDHDSSYSPNQGYNDNTGVGRYALTYARNGANTAIGAQSLYGLHNGYCNVAVGYYAGAYLDAEYTPYDPDHVYTDYSRYLFIDGLDRGNRSDMFSKSMIVGRFNADPTQQTLQLNAKVGFNGATPQGKQTIADEATDLASAITLLNSIRGILINVGLAQAGT